MSRRAKDDDASEEGFLQRWSRRKAEAAAQEDEPALADGADAAEAGEGLDGADAGQEEDAELDDAALLEKHGLQDPETMSAGDDFSGFMKSGVPDRLRNRALRKLWLSNPTLANLDELVDYGEDFTDAATVVENLQTLYKVGRGLLPEEDPAAEGEESADAAAGEDGGEDGGDGGEHDHDQHQDLDGDRDEAASTGEPSAERAAEPTVAKAPVQRQSAASAQGVAAGETTRRPRRMAFRFETRDKSDRSADQKPES